MKPRLLIVSILAALLAFSACRKSERDNDESTLASGDQAMHERLSNDIIGFVDEAARSTQGIKALNCASITIDTMANPKVMTIDFDAFPGCTGNDGFKRGGVVTATFTSKYSVPGSVITISLSNYRTDNLKMTADITMTYMGLNTSSQPYFMVDVTTMRVQPLNEAWVSNWTFSYTRTQTAGDATPEVSSDDTYTLSGTGTGVSRSGNTYEAEIVQDVVWSNGCEYPSDGIVNVTPANLVVRNLEYGACDNLATVNIVDTAYEIEID